MSRFALAVLALAGYLYTAGTLLKSLISELWLLLALIVVHQAIVRWLIVARRSLALQAALERRAHRDPEERGEDTLAPPEEEVPDARLPAAEAVPDEGGEQKIAEDHKPVGGGEEFVKSVRAVHRGGPGAVEARMRREESGFFASPGGAQALGLESFIGNFVRRMPSNL